MNTDNQTTGQKSDFKKRFLFTYKYGDSANKIPATTRIEQPTIGGAVAKLSHLLGDKTNFNILAIDPQYFPEDISLLDDQDFELGLLSAKEINKTSVQFTTKYEDILVTRMKNKIHFKLLKKSDFS